ncbi:MULTISPECIES: hypothetical protein [unclassified Parafrankia]|uniref:hypothetical protein n=2 Tax=Frankiaceae TaxID=74712 RepID=UPI000DA57E5A|nr:hypothetical protein [Parafrankia sp. BMG5.11]SQD96237.1 conserved exported hypothetical protein [Parafrankia sp. Ea1.12]
MRHARTRWTQLPRLAAVVTAMGLALTLGACGGGSDDAGEAAATGSQAGSGASGPLNGIETKPAAEIISAAANALRGADSVHFAGDGVDEGKPASVDLRLDSHGAVTGSMDTNGMHLEVLRVGGVAYVRGEGLVAAYPGARPEQWVKTGPLPNDDNLSLDGAADDIEDMADDLKAGETPTIEQVTEQGQPAVKVTTKSHTLYVANVGEPLPLRQTGTGVDSGTLDATFTEYGQPVTATAPTDVFEIPQAAS